MKGLSEGCFQMTKEDLFSGVPSPKCTLGKKEWNNAICSNMDGPRDYHTKWNKSDRKRQIPYDIIYMWNLKETIQGLPWGSSG